MPRNLPELERKNAKASRLRVPRKLAGEPPLPSPVPAEKRSAANGQKSKAELVREYQQIKNERERVRARREEIALALETKRLIPLAQAEHEVSLILVAIREKLNVLAHVVARSDDPKLFTPRHKAAIERQVASCLREMREIPVRLATDESCLEATAYQLNREMDANPEWKALEAEAEAEAEARGSQTPARPPRSKVDRQTSTRSK
jgi:hypothetical protein